jgi:hypothetical protein
MDPFVPALAVMVKVWRVRANVAVTVVLAFMVTVQDGEVPVHRPDHPVKVEFASAVAASVTTVPALKVVPKGLVATVPVPVPVFVTVRVHWTSPAWVTVKVFPAMVKVPVLEELFGLAETE